MTNPNESNEAGGTMNTEQVMKYEFNAWYSKWKTINGYYDMADIVGHYMYDAWQAAQSIATPQPQKVRSDSHWKDKLHDVVEIYFDGIENPPEERCYVEGSFSELMRELRLLFEQDALIEPLSSSQPQTAKNWCSVNNCKRGECPLHNLHCAYPSCMTVEPISADEHKKVNE